MKRIAFLIAGAVVALAAVAGGTAGVQALITGAQIKDGTIESRDIDNGTIRRVDIGAAALLSLRGERGRVGPRGPRGAIGASGPSGPQGAAGPQGERGAAGVSGATGAEGAQGAKGDPGSGVHVTGSVATAADLPAGAAEGDAYIVTATGHLHVWDGAAWIDTGLVRGPAGPQGDTGLAGQQGPPGPVGPAGPSVSVAVSTAPFSLAAGAADLFTVPCAAGEKAVSGGFTYVSDALVLSSDTVPTADGAGWQLFLINFDETLAVSGTVQVVCLA